MKRRWFKNRRKAKLNSAFDKFNIKMLFEESRPRKHRQGGNSIHILKSRQERAPLAPWLMMIARFCSVLRILPFTKEKEALGKPFWTVWNSNTHKAVFAVFLFLVECHHTELEIQWPQFWNCVRSVSNWCFVVLWPRND